MHSQSQSTFSIFSGESLLKSNENPVSAESLPVIRMENISLLTSNNPATISMDPGATQIITFPILQDGSMTGLDQQNLFFAKTADGNTILLDASQLTLLTDQTIPLYDGTNLFQVATEAPLETSLDLNKSTDTQLQVIENTENQNGGTGIEQAQSVRNDEEILPPDRRNAFRCSICGQEFSEARQLQRHWKMHIDDKPQRCDECDASFNKLTNLVLHQATHRTDDPCCPICKKQFSRMAGLKAHLMLHEIEENLICTECGDEFSTQFRLNKHIQEHLEELAVDKSFICRTCSKGFKKLSNLRDHCKMHYKIKASLQRKVYKKNIDRSSFGHKCFVCGKLFQKPSQLVRHNRIHTGERPYKCEVCNKAFNQKGALLIHKVKHTGVRPHNCEFCPASFAQKGNLRNHIRRVHTLLPMDSSDNVHKCDLCSCVFKKLGSLNAHMSRAHTVGNIQLASCSSDAECNPNEGEPTTSNIGLNNKSDEQINPLKNVINQLIQMSEETRNQEINQEKIKKIVSDTNINPDILQQALENSGLASNNNNNQIGEKSSKPLIMNVMDNVTGTLNTHIMRNVNGVRWYQCMYCSKEFKKPSDLVRHIRIHTHEKPYKCDQCYRAFAVRSTLNAHVRTHLGTKDFSCEHCKKFFATSGSLKVHLLLHTGSKPFSCNICNKAFRTSGHRNSHMLSHKADKTQKKRKKVLKPVPNVTDINVSDIPLQEPILITDSGYIQQVPKLDALNMMAENSNPSERPYLCVYCQKCFKKSSHLKQHIRSHTGEKPFKCLQCQKSFVSNGVLKSHLKTHTGIKSYNCSVCDAAFTTNGSLKRHMSIHRDDRPYMCPYCQKTFKTAMNCKKHMKTHRYELAMGMANTGVTVTVISNNPANAENQKELQDNTQPQSHEIENADENGQPILASFTTASFNPEDDTVALETMPEHLSQEVFNTQTGMIEQAEIIPQVQNFDPNQGNIFTLSSSDFIGNNLTLQLENNEDHEALNTADNDNLVSNASDIVTNENQHASSYEHIKDVTKGPKRKRSKKPYQCDICSKLFKKSSKLKLHMVSHTGERPFRCNICGNMYRSKDLLTVHMANHEKTREYCCNKCQALFATKKALVRHSILHDSRLQCSYCYARLENKELYKEHLKTFHYTGINAENIENNGFNTAQEIMTEEVIADSIIQIRMNDSINEERIRSDYLPKHPNVCSHCPKSFKKQSDLIRHTRIHTGEKPYACEICSKAFTVKSTLDCHMKTHSGEKEFPCNVCCSNFATKGSLKVHMRLHTGDRPFKCSQCDLAFRTSGHRKSHLASHFKEKSSRKRKRINFNTDLLHDDHQNEKLQPSAFPEEVITLTNENCTDVQVPILQEDMQLPNLSGQNIQIATVDPNFLSKPIQIDPALLQQLQQNININITLTQDQVNKLMGFNQTQPVINIDTTPASNATYTINPIVLNPISYTIPQQTETPASETISLSINDFNLAKNYGNDIFSNREFIDSRLLTFDNSAVTEITLESAGKSCENPPNYPEATSLNQSEDFMCSICYRMFKTIGQLNAHEKVHKILSNYIYHCEVCKKHFKKKHHFNKHVQNCKFVKVS